jgi:hypothetical protein
VLPSNREAAGGDFTRAFPNSPESGDLGQAHAGCQKGSADQGREAPAPGDQHGAPGQLRDFRQFIYALESAPEFPIVDDVVLTEGNANEPLTFVVTMSTYFRAAGNGA